MTVLNEIAQITCSPRPANGKAPAASRRTISLDLGFEEYAAAYALQSRLNLLRQTGEIPNAVLFVEHPPCITLGRTSHPENILATSDELKAHGIAVHRTDRGGDVTYHGPGQLVLYAVVHLDDYARDVHAHARRLEQVLIDTLDTFGVPAGRVKGYPGVWTAQGKIGTLGLSVKRWVTMHGVALNVCPDMSAFELIVPCGLEDRRVTSLAQIVGREVEIDEIKSRVQDSFERVFGVSLIECGPEDRRVIERSMPGQQLNPPRLRRAKGP